MGYCKKNASHFSLGYERWAMGYRLLSIMFLRIPFEYGFRLQVACYGC